MARDVRAPGRWMLRGARSPGTTPAPCRERAAASTPRRNSQGSPLPAAAPGRALAALASRLQEPVTAWHTNRDHLSSCHMKH